MKLQITSETETLNLAGRFYRELPSGCLVFLQGNLGAGKTAFVRGCLRAAGHQGAVKSPTFTLVEEYSLQERMLYHFDLYRVADPEELEWMGMRDYLRPDSICFIEWPEKGAGLLPLADIEIAIDIQGTARNFQFQAHTEVGRQVLDRFNPEV